MIPFHVPSAQHVRLSGRLFLFVRRTIANCDQLGPEMRRAIYPHTVTPTYILGDLEDCLFFCFFFVFFLCLYCRECACHSLLTTPLILLHVLNPQVKATNGDTLLGGEDFDELVFGHLVEAFKADQGIDLSQDSVATQRLREAAEVAKRELDGMKVSGPAVGVVLFL